MKKFFMAFCILSLFVMPACKKVKSAETANDVPEAVAESAAVNEVKSEPTAEAVNEQAPKPMPAECFRWFDSECPERCRESGLERRGCFVTKAVVEEKVSTGTDINAVNEKNETALMYAWDAEAVKALIAAKADVNAMSSDGTTAIYHMRNDPKSVRLLLDAGADVRVGISALEGCHNIDSIKMLLAAGADVNAVNPLVSITPIMYAGNVEVAKLLLEAGADVDASADEGYCALIHAVMSGNIELVQLYIEHKADVNADMLDGNTPIMLVTRLEIAKLLVEAGAKLDVRNMAEQSVIDRIRQNEQIKDTERNAIIDYLRAKGAR